MGRLRGPCFYYSAPRTQKKCRRKKSWALIVVVVVVIVNRLLLFLLFHQFAKWLWMLKFHSIHFCLFVSLFVASLPESNKRFILKFKFIFQIEFVFPCQWRGATVLIFKLKGFPTIFLLGYYFLGLSVAPIYSPGLPVVCQLFSIGWLACGAGSLPTVLTVSRSRLRDLRWGVGNLTRGMFSGRNTDKIKFLCCCRSQSLMSWYWKRETADKAAGRGSCSNFAIYLIYTHAYFFVQTLFIYVIKNCVIYLFRKKWPLARENER